MIINVITVWNHFGFLTISQVKVKEFSSEIFGIVLRKFFTIEFLSIIGPTLNL